MPTRTATLGALIIASAFVLAASLIPYDLTAQESDPITASCVRLTRNLYLGMNDAQTGGQVTKRHRFLTQTAAFHSAMGLLLLYRAAQPLEEHCDALSPMSPTPTQLAHTQPRLRWFDPLSWGMTSSYCGQRQ